MSAELTYLVRPPQLSLSVLARLLACNGFDIARTSACIRLLLARAPDATRPDLVILDCDLASVRLPEEVGRLRERFPDARILGLVDGLTCQDSQDFAQVLDGWIVKGSGLAELTDALVHGAAGARRPQSIPLPRSALPLPDGRTVAKVGEPVQGSLLSPAERRLLRTLLEGWSRQELASRLQMPEAIVVVQVAALLHKLAGLAESPKMN